MSFFSFFFGFLKFQILLIINHFFFILLLPSVIYCIAQYARYDMAKNSVAMQGGAAVEQKTSPPPPPSDAVLVEERLAALESSLKEVRSKLEVSSQKSEEGLPNQKVPPPPKSSIETTKPQPPPSRKIVVEND